MTQNVNGAPAKGDSSGSPDEWKAQAQFWQMKYFELLSHSNQIIAALARPTIASQVNEKLTEQLKGMNPDDIKARLAQS